MKCVALVAVTLALATRAVAQSRDLPPIVRAGLEAYKARGADSALATWLKNSPVPAQSTPPARAALEQIESSYGHMTGYDVLSVVPLGSHVARTYLMILYERGPLYAWFDTYRSTDDWVLTGFLFNTKPDLILPPALFPHSPQVAN